MQKNTIFCLLVAFVCVPVGRLSRTLWPPSPFQSLGPIGSIWPDITGERWRSYQHVKLRGSTISPSCAPEKEEKKNYTVTKQNSHIDSRLLVGGYVRGQK